MYVSWICSDDISCFCIETVTIPGVIRWSRHRSWQNCARTVGWKDHSINRGGPGCQPDLFRTNRDGRQTGFVCTALIKRNANIINILMKWYNVTGIWQVRIYDIGNRWYEENKQKWAEDRALGYTCGYCCVGWGALKTTFRTLQSSQINIRWSLITL